MIMLKEKVLLIPKKFTITIRINSENLKKKQEKVFYILTILFNFLTDLNYSVVRFWLEIME